MHLHETITIEHKILNYTAKKKHTHQTLTSQFSMFVIASVYPYSYTKCIAINEHK